MTRNLIPRKVLLPLAILVLASSLVFCADMMTEPSPTGYVAVCPSAPECASDPLPTATPGERWDLSRIMAYQTWPITSGKRDVLVAVLDTGIDQSHRNLAGKVVAGINFTHSPTANDLHGHGTYIAGIIAAISHNATGTTGLAYSCSLMNVKIAEDDGSTSAATVAKGIVWAVDRGARVINISLVIKESSPVLEAAVNYAWNKGSIVVAAAGNNYSSTPVYPAAYANVIAVAATDKSDRRPQWSNHGDWVTVSAPGVDIYSTLPGNRYAPQSGTSSAAALVSGEAALLFSLAKDANGNGRVNDEVCSAIKGNADTVAIEGLGAGRINVLKAVTTVGTAQKVGGGEPNNQ